MTDAELPARKISGAERQATVDRLCQHFAQDNLDTAELERRLDLAYAAQSSGELIALERDLPALRAQPEATPEIAPLPLPSPSALIDPTRPMSERDFMVSVMGGTERSGGWTPPRTLTALSLMGGATLDYREARFATGEVSLRLLTLMGGVDIIVPPGVRVEWNGVAIMGGVGMADVTEPASPSAPLIRITGLVLMGGVDITERLPGESAREARKRIKAERKAQRQLRSGKGDPAS